MEAVEGEVMMSNSTDFDKVTLRALRSATISKVSDSLNPLKVLPTEEGLLRDWRGLAQLAGLDGNAVSSLKFKPDPTAEVLKLWVQDSQANVASLGLLRSCLSRMDRWDVLDDAADMFEEDVKLFNARKDNTHVADAQIRISADKHILTVDDVGRIEKGLLPQNYDAFLLFAEEDVDFATTIVDKMENEYGLKLCIRDRDLVGGLTFEHEAIMKLIAERCNRLIVVVSPNFLKSEANKFFVTFAQALGIEQRQRKVVPCLYQRCQLPPELSYYFLLDFNRAGKLWNVWEKLRDSIQAPNLSSSCQLGQGHSQSTAVNTVGPPMCQRNAVHLDSKDCPPLMQQRDPPPPYSPPVTALGAGVYCSETNIPISTPDYGSAGNLDIPKFTCNRKQTTPSLSASESNLVTKHVHLDSRPVGDARGSEWVDNSQLEGAKDKLKPLKWLRRFIPKDKDKKKRCRRRAVEA